MTNKILKCALVTGLLMSCNADIKDDSTKMSGNKKYFDMVLACIKQNKFTIESTRKSFDTIAHFYKSYKDTCSSWKLNAGQIALIFSNSKTINGIELHDYYFNLPCSYDGVININHHRFTFTVNAGAYSTISLFDTFICLGYVGTDKNLFVDYPSYDKK